MRCGVFASVLRRFSFRLRVIPSNRLRCFVAARSTSAVSDAREHRKA